MSKLLSRFQGSLVGAVLGDCIGAVYELGGEITLSEILNTIYSIEASGGTDNKGKQEEILYSYTDDTAMARSVAGSLIKHKGFQLKDMVKRFTSEYKSEPDRGYGGNVTTVFQLLDNPELEDLYEPARKQFDGQGSFGNGGSMRIVPAALFSYNKDHSYVQTLTRQITEITHSHEQAIQGAILQCLAVHLALHADNTTPLDTDLFVDNLKTYMNKLEEEELKKPKVLTPTKKRTTRSSEKRDKPYCYKLDKIKEYLNQEKEVTVQELIDVLGNDISALGSVPAAVFSFLRSSKPMTGELKDRNSFEKTIIYAISLNGDTDTIATMAGAIAGAYYGIEAVPKSWQTCCEGVTDAIQYANQLEEFVSKSK
ncbi:hypothetical protein SNE40_017791 [Patella caerulea]|uniref:ADP-ribosylhydrolase ARH3 n=1 Tax=Patella caerulea TaxID=87958 RepID=A0AAN8JEI4_PATCE